MESYISRWSENQLCQPFPTKLYRKIQWVHLDTELIGEVDDVKEEIQSFNSFTLVIELVAPLTCTAHGLLTTNPTLC